MNNENKRQKQKSVRDRFVQYFRCSILIALLSSSLNSYAIIISTAGIKNSGSIVAALASCEGEKYIPIGSATELLKTLKDAADDTSFSAILAQYRNSLHDGKIYSIAKDHWYDFSPTKKDCESLYRAYPSVINHFRSLKK